MLVKEITVLRQLRRDFGGQRDSWTGNFFPEILFSPFFTIVPSVLNIQISFIQVKLKIDNILNKTLHFENHKKHLNTLCFKLRSFLTHCGRVTQICVFTLQLCKTDDANLRF